MKPYSITRRLIWIVLLIELISALSVTAVAVIYERHLHFRAFDVSLRGRADSILGAVQDAEDTADNVMMDGSEANMPREDVYEVRDASGRIVGKSANWREAEGADLDALLTERRRGHDAEGPDHEAFSSLQIGGRQYRIIRITGVRIVDPGDKGGGVRRNVTVYYGSPSGKVWNAVLRSAGIYAAGSILVLALTGFLMFWLLNRGLAPLRELALSAEAVSAASWSFDPPEAARMTRELAPLVTAMESLLGGLEASFEQQKRFVGDAAHELKTSVAVVKSSLQLLGMKPRSTAEYRFGLARCLNDCDRMEAVVAQMLTLARVEEHTLTEPDSLRTELASSLREVHLELLTMADAQNTRILIQADQPVVAKIDVHQFKLLCTNLLMNALQHSPPGSEVRVLLRQVAVIAELTITDSGDGIAAGDLPRVFDRFFRGDPSRSRKTGGAGLGLAICKAIVDRAGGSIAIQSEKDVGATVVVCLPLHT